ncbi:unnamed protein product [Cercospora beticola]|nr:unnamed protein product [Cercospora beticola]
MSEYSGAPCSKRRSSGSVETPSLNFLLGSNQLCGAVSRPDATVQRRLVPHDEDLVIIPLLALFAQFQVEVKQDFCQNETGLMVCHTILQRREWSAIDNLRAC